MIGGKTLLLYNSTALKPRSQFCCVMRECEFCEVPYSFESPACHMCNVHVDTWFCNNARHTLAITPEPCCCRFRIGCDQSGLQDGQATPKNDHAFARVAVLLVVDFVEQQKCCPPVHAPHVSWRRCMLEYQYLSLIVLHPHYCRSDECDAFVLEFLCRSHVGGVGSVHFCDSRGSIDLVYPPLPPVPH